MKTHRRHLFLYFFYIYSHILQPSSDKQQKQKSFNGVFSYFYQILHKSSQQHQNNPLDKFKINNTSTKNKLYLETEYDGDDDTTDDDNNYNFIDSPKYKLKKFDEYIDQNGIRRSHPIPIKKNKSIFQKQIKK